MYIVLYNEAKKRVYNAQSGTNIVINKTDLPKVSYEIYLLVLDEYGNSHYDKLDKYLIINEDSKFKSYMKLLI